MSWWRLPKMVAGLEAKLKAVEGQRAVVVDLIAKEEALRRRQESDTRDLRAKIEKVRKQLDHGYDDGAGDGVRARDRVCEGGDQQDRGRGAREHGAQ